MSLIFLVFIGIVLLAIAGAFVGFMSILKGRYVGFVAMVAAFALLSMGSSITSLLFSRFTEGQEKIYEVTRSTPLLALANTSEVAGTDGRIYVRINEKDMLSYVEKGPNDTYFPQKMEAKGVPLKEDATEENARIETVSCQWADPRVTLLVGACGSVTTVHVPPGSIVRDFTVEAGRD